MAAVGPDAPAARRGARLRAGGIRPHRAADEADPWGEAEAVQAQGSRDERRFLPPGRLSGQGDAVLPARSRQRVAGRDAAGRGAGRADQAVRAGRRGTADRPGEARGHQRRPYRDPQRAGDPGGDAHLAAKHGFAQSAKAYRQAPADYPGSIKEASYLIRIALTGSTRSPDLASVARVLGRDEVMRRVSALTS